MDISETLAPASDQLDAIELVTHPAGRITARCTRCADELEAKYERRTA